MALRSTIAAVLTLASVLPAGALAAGADGWHGKTSQGFAADAFVSRSGALLDRLRMRYQLDCSDGSTSVRPFLLSRRAGDTVTIAEDGRFASAGTFASGLPDKGSGSLTYRVTGRVRPGKLVGLLKVDYALDSGVTCTTKSVAFVLR